MTNAKAELEFARGMVSRRQRIIEDLGTETSKAEVLNNFQALLVCLKEVQKHHNRIMSAVDDRTAGLAVESGLLVDSCHRWLAQSRTVCDAWGIAPAELARMERAVFNA